MTSSAAEAAGTDPSPLERAIAGEERALLWRELAALPAAYREPLVLFYWEDRSVERVAAALELDEQTVRQRLSRRRRMLREQLLALADRELVRARPRREFAAAVVAALPTGLPGAAATAGAAKATGVSGAGAVGTGAALGGAVAGSLVGLAGAYVGALASIRGTRSPRERQLMVRMAWLMAAVTLGFAALDVAS